MKYICWVEDCKEDLTEKVKEIVVSSALSVMEGEKGKKRIYVECSKKHKNIFEVLVKNSST